MTDEWLRYRLRITDEPVVPGREFADALYGELVVELGLVAPRRAGDKAAGRRGADAGSAGRRRLLPKALLIAAVVGAAVVASVAGIGGLLNRGQPDTALVAMPRVCGLVAPAEIEAIVGFPVVMTVSPTETRTADGTTESCVLERRGPITPEWATPPNVILSLTRYAHPSDAREHLGPGSSDFRSIPDLGDGAALYYFNPQFEVLVLRGTDVLAVGGSIQGISGAITPPQAIAIARLILARM